MSLISDISLPAIACKLFLRNIEIAPKPGDSDLSGHENAVGIGNIVRERAAKRKPETRVKPPGRREIIHGTGFQTETPITSPFGFLNQVLNHFRCDAPPLILVCSAHRFDFAVICIQLFQGATSSKLRTIPHAPEGDIWLSQPIEIQRVPAFRRGNHRHAAEVFLEQFDDFQTSKIVEPNFHFTAPCHPPPNPMHQQPGQQSPPYLARAVGSAFQPARPHQ